MPPFFPHHTHEWHLEEPAAFRRFTLSLVGMAAVTGVLVRLFRALVLGPSLTNPLVLGVSIVLGLVFLLVMVTGHIGNYPVRQWLWRVPAFIGVELAAEVATSLALTALGRERWGTVEAHYHDLPQMARDALLGRAFTIIPFVLLLAGVVQLVRHLLLRRDHRLHTAIAIHDEHLRQTAEHHSAGPDVRS
jgi:hypothetical protein